MPAVQGGAIGSKNFAGKYKNLIGIIDQLHIKRPHSNEIGLFANCFWNNFNYFLVVLVLFLVAGRDPNSLSLEPTPQFGPTSIPPALQTLVTKNLFLLIFKKIISPALYQVNTSWITCSHQCLPECLTSSSWKRWLPIS